MAQSQQLTKTLFGPQGPQGPKGDKGDNGTGVGAVTPVKTSAYTAVAGDVVQADPTSGSFNVTLPAAGSNPLQVITVKFHGSSGNTVTVLPTGSDTIDGSASFALTGGGAATYVSNGSNNWVQTSGAGLEDLSSASPQPVGSASAGTSLLASRADHVHPHGDQGGGSLHATATESLPGFMSAADKAKIDAVEVVADLFPGSDIGAKVNNALASLGSGGGTVRILDGNNSQSTQIVMLPNTVLQLGAGLLDQTPIVGIPAILMQDNCTVRGVPGRGSKVKEPQFSDIGGAEFMISISDYTSWYGGRDVRRDSNHHLLVKDIHFVAQTGGSEITSTDAATVTFFNIHDATVDGCYFERTHSFGACAGGESDFGYYADGWTVTNCVFEGLWSQGACAVNAAHIRIQGNRFFDNEPVAVTYVDIECNATTDSAFQFQVTDNIFDILPNTGADIQPGAAIQVTSAVFMDADLTHTYLPNVTFGIISRNTINGGTYPVAGTASQLTQGILALRLTNTIISDNNINNTSNINIGLALCRGCTVSGNKLTNASGSNYGIGLRGCQMCVVTGNHITDENYPSCESDPDIGEYDENGGFNGGTPVASDYNFIYGNTMAFYPFVIPGSSGSTLQERRTFVDLVGPNSRAYSNICQGHVMDDVCLQNITELRSAPFPGTRNASGAPAMVRLAGLNAPLDGGGAIWVWDPTSTATDNGVTVVACNLPIPPSTADGRWLRALPCNQFSTSDRISLSLTSTDAGFLAFDTTLSAYYLWTGSAWATLGGGASTGNWDFSGNNADLSGAGTLGIGLSTATAVSLGAPTSITGLLTILLATATKLQSWKVGGSEVLSLAYNLYGLGDYILSGAGAFVGVQNSTLDGFFTESGKTLLTAGGVSKVSIDSVGLGPITDLAAGTSNGNASRRWTAGWHRVYAGIHQDVSAAGAVSIDTQAGEMCVLTPTANVSSITLAAGQPAQMFTLEMVQAASATWPTSIVNARLAGGSFAKTVTSGAVDSITFRYNATNATWDETSRTLALA